MLTQLLTIDDFDTHPLYIVENSFGTDELDGIILETQTELAESILGHVLYVDFDADFNGEDFDTQKWTDFVDGYSYEVDGKTVNWLGFKNLLKYFVYFNYGEYTLNYASNLGNVKPKAENGDISRNYRKYIKQYNKGVDLFGIDYNSLFDNNYIDLRRYKRDDYIDTDLEEVKPTAYNFLYNRMSEFDNWEFKEQRYHINQFGI